MMFTHQGANGNSGYVNPLGIRSAVLQYPIGAAITAYELEKAIVGDYSARDIVRYFSGHEGLQTHVGIRMERVWIERSGLTVIFFRRTI